MMFKMVAQIDKGVKMAEINGSSTWHGKGCRVKSEIKAVLFSYGKISLCD